MYRRIKGFLEPWKESEHRKPLILQRAKYIKFSGSGKESGGYGYMVYQ